MPDPAADPAFFCAQNSHGVNTPLQAEEAAASAAPFLFNFEELSAEKLEGVGEFTGERLLARRPDAYRAIIRMSAEGLSISAQARALGVSRNTVCAVRDREGFSIEQDKKDLLRDVRRAARLSVERAIELVPSINSAKDAAIVAAVMVDKMQLLSGEATARVERVEVSQDKLAEMLASLPVLEAEVVLTGPSADAPEQKGAAALPAGMPTEAVALAGSDAKSEGLASFADRGSAMSATLSATSPHAAGVEPVEAVAVAVDQEGGEGVTDFAPPPSQPTGLGSQKFLDKGVSDAPQDASDSSTLP
jgi:DNA-directed RNA polymerase specialized sigma24 family protein